MNDEKLGQLLYGGSNPEAGSDPAAEPLEKRSDEELGALIYPEPDGRFVSHDDTGRVATLIRDIDGEKLHEGNYFGDRRALVAANAPFLKGADLREGIRLEDLDLHGGVLDNGSIAGQDAQGLRLRWGSAKGLDARGTNLASGSFAYPDVRGLLVNSDTDISRCNFEGAFIDQATYDALRRCKGASTAQNLAVRSPQKE